MATNDRNVWDPQTPPDHTELSQEGLAVDLCVYIFDQSTRVDQTAAADLPGAKTAEADIRAAAAIWGQPNARINLQAVHLERLAGFPNAPVGEGQVDLGSPDLAALVGCPFSEVVQNQFFNLPRSGCPDLSESLAIFYIPGDRFPGGATGCHRYYQPAADVAPRHLIVVTDNADGRVLAHEIGHALLTREVNPTTWTNNDPDPNADPAQPIHNLDSENLMFPAVNAEHPLITRYQGSTARESVLVRHKPLAYGYLGQQLDLGVTIDTLTVHSSDDEETSDDALESSWQFYAFTRPDGAGIDDPSTYRNGTRVATWEKDPLHWYTYSLNKDLSPLQVLRDTDKLTVIVTGSDSDSGPFDDDDLLPTIVDDRSKGGDEWGTTSTNVAGGHLGQHRERRTSSDIDYSLTYTIRVASPRVQVTFRTIY